jgi:hypothetical protein
VSGAAPKLPPDRHAAINDLARLLARLTEAGDLTGAYVAAETLARLLGAQASPTHTEGAQVIDLASRRRGP